MSVVEQMHYEHRSEQSHEVREERGVEVSVGFPAETVVVPQQQRDEDSRHNDVTEAEHREVAAAQSFLEQILRKHQFDRCLERSGHKDHHVRSKDPEDVIDEETAQEDTSGYDVVQVQELDAVDRESNAKQIVRDPVLKVQTTGI